MAEDKTHYNLPSTTPITNLILNLFFMQEGSCLDFRLDLWLTQTSRYTDWLK